MGDLIPYEKFREKQREKKYGTAGKRFGGLPRLSDEAITALCTPEVLMEEMDENED